MRRFTLHALTLLVLVSLLLSSCSALNMIQQSVSPAQDEPLPALIEVEPQPAAPETPAEAETQPAAHGELPEPPAGEPQLIGPETAILLREVDRIEIENPYRLIWSKDGTRIALAWLKIDPQNEKPPQSGLSLLDANTLETLSTVVVQEPITVLDFSPGTGLMATTSDQINLELREIQTGQIVRTISPENGFSNAVFSTDGSMVAISSWDEIAVTLWETATGEQIKKLTGFQTAAPVYDVKFSSDDRFLIWVARGSAQVMTISSGGMGAFLGHEDFIGDAELSPDGHFLAVTTAGTVNDEYTPIVKIWDATSGLDMGTLVEGTSVSQSLAFSPDGSLLIVTQFNELSVWDFEKQTKVHSLSGHLDMVSSTAFSPDGRSLVSASADGTVRLWQAR